MLLSSASEWARESEAELSIHLFRHRKVSLLMPRKDFFFAIDLDKCSWRSKQAHKCRVRFFLVSRLLLLHVERFMKEKSFNRERHNRTLPSTRHQTTTTHAERAWKILFGLMTSCSRAKFSPSALTRSSEKPFRGLCSLIIHHRRRRLDKTKWQLKASTFWWSQGEVCLAKHFSNPRDHQFECWAIIQIVSCVTNRCHVEIK